MHSLSTFSSKKITLTASLLGVVMAMSACSKSDQATTTQQDQTTTKPATTLNIGFQKYGTLPVLKARGTLEQALKSEGVNVRWVEFPAGPQLLEGLNVGSVVFGETGEAPLFLHKQPMPSWSMLPINQQHPKQKRLLCLKIQLLKL